MIGCRRLTRWPCLSCYFTGQFWTELRTADCAKSDVYTYKELWRAQRGCIHLGATCVGVIHDLFRDDCPEPRDPNYAHYDYYQYRTQGGATYYLCTKEDEELTGGNTPCVSQKYRWCPNEVCKAHIECPPGTITKVKGSATSQAQCEPVASTGVCACVFIGVTLATLIQKEWL